MQVTDLGNLPALQSVRALYAISRMLQRNPVEGALKILKAVKRMLRDIIVLRCKYVCKEPKDRAEFLQVAAEAYVAGGFG
eukprot:9444-Karenia_brevis.AAC.1